VLFGISVNGQLLLVGLDIPVTRRVKGYTRFVRKYVTGRSVSDPIKYIYS